MSLDSNRWDFDSDSAPVSDINMTPLIDVMLVLLIIFIVTMPILHGAVKVELPTADNAISEPESNAIVISLQADGKILWDDHPVSDSEFEARVQSAAGLANRTVRLHADENVRYEKVAYVLSAVKNGGLSKIDFVTQPVHVQ